jgi:hypothetical protein
MTVVVPPTKPLDSPWAVDHFIDCRERLWHWECAGRVLGAWMLLPASPAG